MLEEACANAVLDLCDSILQLLRDSLPLEGVNGVGVCRSGHNDECHNGSFGVGLLQPVVETYGSRDMSTER